MIEGRTAGRGSCVIANGRLLKGALGCAQGARAKRPCRFCAHNAVTCTESATAGP